MKEIVYSFLGFAHQVPLRSTIVGTAVYNGEAIHDFGYLLSSFFSEGDNLAKVTFSGQKNFTFIVPVGTTFYSVSSFAITIAQNTFVLTDSTQTSIEVPYLICDNENVIAGQYFFPRNQFPAGFNKPGLWNVASETVQNLSDDWINMLRSVNKLPDLDISFDENKSRIMSYLASTGLNIAKWVTTFYPKFETDDEKQERLDAAITPVVNLFARRLTKAQKIELIQKIDEEGLPEECSEPGMSFDFLVDMWVRSLIWNIIYDFSVFHEPKFRHQQAIPYDLGGRLYNQAMPRFY